MATKDNSKKSSSGDWELTPSEGSDSSWDLTDESPEAQNAALLAKQLHAANATKEAFGAAMEDIPKHRPRNLSDLRAMGEAALVGPAQAITYGHVPQIAGAISSKIKGTPFVNERDQIVKDLAEIRARAPFTYAASNFLTNLMASKAIPVGNSLGKATAISAAQGAAYNPGDQEGVVDPLQLGERSKNSLMAGILGFFGHGGGELSAKAGDRLMQKSVGRTKYTPGVGEDLARENIWGTREMMKKQVNRKTKDIAAQTKALVQQHPNLISSQPIADEVSALNDRWKIPSGRANSPLDIPAMTEREAYANEINRRGMQSAEDILQDRINAGQRVPETAWENRTPQERLTTEISKAEQRGASNVLKANVPGVGELDRRYVPLAKAKKPLNKEESINKPQGIPGISSIPGSSIGMSTLGQIGVRGGRGVQRITPALINSLLEQYMQRQHYEDEGQQ